jgi:hypothetical protein
LIGSTLSLDSFEGCLVIQFIAGVKIAIHELLVYFEWLFSGIGTLLGYFFCSTVFCEGASESTALVSAATESSALVSAATECTALVPAGYWDAYYSGLNSNIPQLGTLKSARAFVISPYLYGIIIGVILSDGCLRIHKSCKNACLQLGQSKAHEAYL